MEEKFILMPNNGIELTKINSLSIPFNVKKNGENIECLELNREYSFNSEDKCSHAFLLGMVTKEAYTSEWWQTEESNYANHSRVFLGDNLCYIFILYEDETQESIPAIFGYNAFNYELYSDLKTYEDHLNSYGGPYREPFESDPDAAKLLDESLCLNHNPEGGKGNSYVLAVKLKNKPVKALWTRRAPEKTAGIYISSITCLKTGEKLPESVKKVLDPASFFNRAYTPKLEKLARRLYQYKEDIPDEISLVLPEGYKGPVAKFYGKNTSAILSNVYHMNLMDMSNEKITKDGMPHTSSRLMPNFGSYIGMGTFSVKEGDYFKHIWTRDVGRLMIELSRAGLDERLLAATEHMHRFLYDKSDRFDLPNWKRIANAANLWAPDGDTSGIRGLCGKENDGHAAVMIAIYDGVMARVLDRDWVDRNKKHIMDAANWYLWQIENPEESAFDKVLYSDSEASVGNYGGYDLFSNAISHYALTGYSRIGKLMGWKDFEKKCEDAAKTIRKGIDDVFLLDHPVHGEIYVDNNYDCWTYGYKRFGLLFEGADLLGYEPFSGDKKFMEIIKNTMKAQINEFYSPYSGRQMGYGQGFITQIQLLSDDVQEYSNCLDVTACYCYHNHDYKYIVPEGVIVHPTKRFWFRNSDLGNAVQQAETIKSIRLMIGIEDDYVNEKINFVPRMPMGMDKMDIKEYPVNDYSVTGTYKKTLVNVLYQRKGKGYKIKIQSERDIFAGYIRIGPFERGYFENFNETKDDIRRIGDCEYLYINPGKPFTEFEKII